MIARLRHWLRGSDRGSPAAEMGLVLPLLLFLIGGALEFGLIIFQVIEVNNAVEAGAAYAAVHSSSCCSNAFYNNIETVIQHATGLGSNVQAGTPSSFCGCPNGASPPAIGSQSCTAQCNNGLNAGTYVTVSAGYNIVSNLLPWLPNGGRILPPTINYSTTVRIQ